MRVYRSHILGACPRYLSAKVLGYEEIPPPEWLSRIMAEGQLHEKAVIEYLQSEGYQPHDLQKEVTIQVAGALVLGHIDCLIYENGSEAIAEIKSASASQFKEFKHGLPDRYLWQVSAYMLAENKPAIVFVKCRNTGELYNVRFYEPPVLFENIEAKISQIESYVSKFELYPHAGSEDCFLCSTRYLCPTELESSIVFHPQLSYAADMYRRGKTLADEGERLIEQARAIFAEYARETPRYIVDGLKIQRIDVHRKEPDIDEIKRLLGHCPIREKVISQLRIQDTRG